MDATMTIGQAAARAGTTASRIRYYESIGVLPEAERLSGQRRYDDGVVRRLEIIEVAQRAGLSLDEIRALLDADAGGVDAKDQLRALAGAHLPGIRALLDRARAVEQWLETAGSCGCQTIDECGLFDAAALAGSATAPATAGAPQLAVAQHAPITAG